MLDKEARKIGAVERGLELEIGVVETDVAQLANAGGDGGRPIFAAGFHHPRREAVQRDVEDVPTRAFEIGGEAAELRVVFEEQDAMAEAGEAVRTGHSGETGADYNDVVVRLVRRVSGGGSAVGGGWHAEIRGEISVGENLKNARRVSGAAGGF
jgi:hypothetical protein